MRRTGVLCGCICVVLFLASLGLAQGGGVVPPDPTSRIIYVDRCYARKNGDGLSPGAALGTVQAAIDLAHRGDRVFVAEGLYRESLDLKGKAITIKGIAGPRGVPEVLATGQSAVQMLSGEDSDTVLKNLIIRDSLIGVSLVDSNPTLQNLTVVKCGIGVLGLGQSDPNINSCILWDNTLEDLAGVTAYYSCIERRSDVSRLYNMSADPLFVDSEQNDFRLKSIHGRYDSVFDQWGSDEFTSPCISTGDPAREFGMELQPHGDRINMGAFGDTMFASTGPDPSSVVRIISFGGGSSSEKGRYLSATVQVDSPERETVRVEFYADGVLVAQDDGSRGNWYEGEWTSDLADEKPNFELIVVAEDEYGVRSLSEPAIFPTGTGHGGGR